VDDDQGLSRSENVHDRTSSKISKRRTQVLESIKDDSPKSDNAVIGDSQEKKKEKSRGGTKEKSRRSERVSQSEGNLESHDRDRSKSKSRRKRRSDDDLGGSQPIGQSEGKSDVDRPAKNKSLEDSGDAAKERNKRGHRSDSILYTHNAVAVGTPMHASDHVTSRPPKATDSQSKNNSKSRSKSRSRRSSQHGRTSGGVEHKETNQDQKDAGGDRKSSNDRHHDRESSSNKRSSDRKTSSSTKGRTTKTGSGTTKESDKDRTATAPEHKPPRPRQTATQKNPKDRKCHSERPSRMLDESFACSHSSSSSERNQRLIS